MTDEEVLKIKNMAALLKVRKKTIYSMVQSGELSPPSKCWSNGGFPGTDMNE